MSAGVSLEPGRQLGDYVVERQFGEGGLERAYVANAVDGRRVIVKVPRFEPGMNPEFLRRFQRQATTAARVSDPNVVAVLGSGVVDGVPYIIEEYAGAATLADKLAGGPLSVDLAVTICGAVAGGLDALHAARIVHRSLTPACVVLDTDWRARVSGFGLAKDHDASQLTRAGHAVGAAAYISPEQIRGEEVSPAADIYALGCLTYEMLTGAAPYADQKGMKGLWAHLHADVPDMRAKRPELSADLSWTVARALAKRPEERPATATTFARLVTVAHEGERPRSVPGSAN